MSIGLRLGIMAASFAACTALAIVSLWIAVSLPFETPRTTAVIQPVWAFDLHGEPKTVPGVVFTDRTGGKSSIEAFRGRVVVLNIWATWCPPCVEELPDLMDLAGRFGEQSLALVALSTDRDPLERVPKFLERYGLTRLPVYYDSNLSASRMLKIGQMPTTLILDRDGHEVARLEGPFDWTDDTAFALIESFIQ